MYTLLIPVLMLPIPISKAVPYRPSPFGVQIPIKMVMAPMSLVHSPPLTIGTIAGKKYGVAKKANIIGVQVLNAQGAGSSFHIAIGIAYVVHEYHRTGRPSVINLSLGTQADPFVDYVVQKAIDEGIYVVAAAGNENQDACNVSPARGLDVITVGAINPLDERAFFSNYGPCVNVFAPGTEIVSTFLGKQYRALAGTSMASPHVAGAVAVILSTRPYTFRSVKKGREYIYSVLTQNRIRGTKKARNSLIYVNAIFSPDASGPVRPPKINRRPDAANGIKSSRSGVVRPASLEPFGSVVDMEDPVDDMDIESSSSDMDMEIDR
jgi:subtilisin family serine protease